MALHFRRFEASTRAKWLGHFSGLRPHCTWQLSGYAHENVEVCSSWRACIEETDFLHKRLQAGDRFGFMATSDSHRACPGLGGALTGVFARELTPEAIFEGLRARRTIATQGRRVGIDFRVNDTFVGGEGRASGAPQLSLAVEAPAPIAWVEIWRNGEAIARAEAPGTTGRIEREDTDAPPGAHVYFVRLKLEGDPSFNAPDHPQDFYRAFITEGRYPGNLARAAGPFAWTSPLWITVEPS